MVYQMFTLASFISEAGINQEYKIVEKLLKLRKGLLSNIVTF